jgi:hypothetical protein
VGEIEEAAGVYAETKIEGLAERKLRLDKPELAQERDKIQHRERQAAIPKIEQTRSIEEELGLLRKKRAGPEGFQRPGRAVVRSHTALLVEKAARINAGAVRIAVQEGVARAETG